MRKRAISIGAGTLALVVILAASWSTVQRSRAQTPATALDVSGRIEGEEVIVNSRVGGRVLQLLVKEGDQVERGQLVAILSSEELDARARQAAAQVDAASAQTTRANSEVAVLEAQRMQAQTAVALVDAQVSAQQLQAHAVLDASLARLAQSRKALAITEGQAPSAVDEARAAVRAAEADLARARALWQGARRDLARLESLLVSGAVAAVVVDDARTRLAVASAQVELNTEQVARARAGLARAQTGLLEVQVRMEEVRAAAAQVAAARSQVAMAHTGALEGARQRDQLLAVTRQVDSARAVRDAARAQLRAATATRDELASALTEARIVAPTPGVVASKVVNAGEVVAAGTPIVVLVDQRALWLKVYVPGPDIARLRLGLPAEIRVDAFSTKLFPARITEISQRAEFTPKDVQTKEERVKQVFAVKLAVNNTEGVLKPGMPADARILWNGEPPR